ncbi:MAG: toluene tolerance protein [Gammaproteobacteria bacterium]|nr:MAG: toluene tolerance protein [Gammaproteobacteria bacterium]
MNIFISSKLPVEPLDSVQFHSLVESAELIVADTVAPKVMKRTNGNMLKFFRRKRLISSAMFAPYALRFVNNAFTLKSINIPSINPKRIFHYPEQKFHIVEYEPLEGDLLRGILQEAQNTQLLELTAEFIAELHFKGVYFRSLHFENIIWNGEKMGLIDVADMKIYNNPLNKRLRQRNHQHYLRYPQDRSILDKFGLEEFMSIYTKAFDRMHN